MNVVIADDELLAREELKFLLSEFPDVEVVAAVENGMEAVEAIEQWDPALAILDIQMPGLDGLAVVRRLKERGIDPPHIIFSTAHDRFAVEAFRVQAMDYLLKPVEKARLGEALERARKSLGERSGEPPAEVASRPAFTKLLLRNGMRNLIVDPSDLIYATIDSGVITLITAGAEGQSNFRTLEELQATLDGDVFWRAHRSFLVNMNRIREVMPWFKSTYQLKMDDKRGSEVPVSRMQSRRLREMLNL